MTMNVKRWIVALSIIGGAQVSSAADYSYFSFWPFQTWDPVSQGSVEIDMPNAEEALLRTVADVRGVLVLFEPAVTGDVRIVEPKRVTGSKENPRMTMSVEKCIGIFCQTIDLVADVSVKAVKGNCKYNWEMDLDIVRSSSMVVDQYDRLQIDACYTARTDRQGTLTLNGKIRRGPRYSKGTIQKAILDVLKAQFPPMSEAFRKSLRKNAGQPNVRLILRQSMLK